MLSAARVAGHAFLGSSTPGEARFGWFACTSARNCALNSEQAGSSVASLTSIVQAMMKDGEPRPAVIDVFALAARDNFARSLGIEIVEASLGRAVSRVRIEERHINFI